jgi:glycosyltransferase involved in cell wall biosynthesis
MRIISVMFSFPPVYSGATKFWLRLVPRLKAHDIDVDIIYRAQDGGFVHLRADGASTPVPEPKSTRRGTYKSSLVTIFRFLWKHRKEYSSALFLGCPDALIASLVARPFSPLRFAYRTTMLGEDDPLAVSKSGRFGWLRLALLKRIDAVICINPALADQSRHAGLTEEQVITVSQGTDVDHFAPASAEERRRIRERGDLPLDGKVVIFVGATVERKGLDLLMKAWPKVLEAHPTARLLLVGPDGSSNGTDFDDPDGTFLRSMKELSETPLYLNSVRFCGMRDDVRELLQAADLFVLPSRMEGTPNVLLEAMAVGLPIVVSDLPGVTGVFVRHEQEALVFPQNDWQLLGACLRRHLDDPDFARACADRARARAVTNFSLASVAEKYAAVFRRLADRSRT